MENRNPNKKVYVCINSWGFDYPFVFAEIDTPALVEILKLDVEVTPLV